MLFLIEDYRGKQVGKKDRQITRQGERGRENKKKIRGGSSLLKGTCGDFIVLFM